jgi:CubicO group peptidase (beta-lactamase class C family)
MRKVINFSVIALIAAITIFLFIPSNTYIRRALAHGNVNIDDYKIFENRTIENSNPIPWKEAENYNQKSIPTHYLPIIKNLGTVAYLVVKDTAIVFEQYWGGYNDSSFSNSFSVAKSIVSLLVGCAIDDGFIKSVDQPVGDFLPEFKIGDNQQLTIKHLLTMSSGLNWNESYQSLFSTTTESYYGQDLKTMVLNLKVVEKPGVQFKYLSCNTQLLSLIIEKATGKTLSEYASERLWKPLGAEHKALWCLDKENGVEKAYCCFNSNARDFARFGQLALNNGSFNGKQIVSKKYITEATSPANWLLDEDGKTPLQNYGYQWWIMKHHGHKVIYARGILGQYIFIIPEKNMVVVRLGHKRCPLRSGGLPADVYIWLNLALEVQ